MYLGRLPVKTAAEADALVAKILGYAQQPPGDPWTESLLFVADKADGAGDFPAISDTIAGLLPPGYTADKVYYKVTHSTPAEAKAAIIAAINDGRLLVNYVGHATIQFWSFASLLTLTDIGSLTNADRLPLAVPMTCLDGYYIHPSPPDIDLSSIGESLVRAPQGGAIASFSPTGEGISHGHQLLDTGLFSAIFLDGVDQLGPATTQAKLYLYANSGGYREFIDTYLLFGDPALALNGIPGAAERRLYLPLVLQGEAE